MFNKLKENTFSENGSFDNIVNIVKYLKQVLEKVFEY